MVRPTQNPGLSRHLPYISATVPVESALQMLLPRTERQPFPAPHSSGAAPTFTEEHNDLCSQVEDLPVIWLLGTIQADSLEWISTAPLTILPGLGRPPALLLGTEKALEGKG